MNSDLKYLYVDGDNIGLRIETSFLNNDEQSLITINQAVKDIVAQITAYLIRFDQEVIFSGADGIIAKGNNLNYAELLKNIRNIDKNFTFSIGIGSSLRDSYIALRYAKSINKNVAVSFKNSEFLVVN